MSLGILPAHQAKLPPLPVPAVSATVERWLESVRPLCSSPAEFEEVARLGAEFAGSSTAAALQEGLLKRAAEAAARGESWLQTWWESLAYFGWREPLQPSEAVALLPDPLGRKLGQVERAASLVRGMLLFRQTMINGTLRPDTAGATPLCMWQYERLFGGTRVAGTEADSRTNASWQRERHVVVLAGGQVYAVVVADAEGRPAAEAAIAGSLRAIAAHARAMPAPYPALGACTSDDRALWAASCRALLAPPRTALNGASLDAISRALFAVCLDDTSPGGDASALMHASMVGPNVENRWCDKSLNLIAFADGEAGGSMEHSGERRQRRLGSARRRWCACVCVFA